MFNKERKNIIKIKTMLEKNRHQIFRIIVSEEFMLQLAEHADLVEIDNKQIKTSSDYNAHGHNHLTENIIDQTYLYKIPCFMSASILRGAVVEMKNGEFFVLKNI